MAQFKEEYHDFQPPLDIVDGAARVLDPLFNGINTGTHWCRKFLKDYFPIDLVIDIAFLRVPKIRNLAKKNHITRTSTSVAVKKTPSPAKTKD